jgi:hypothetical protein
MNNELEHLQGLFDACNRLFDAAWCVAQSYPRCLMSSRARSGDALRVAILAHGDYDH